MPENQPAPPAANAAPPLFYRYAEVADDAADEQHRTLQLAFSSEWPVERKAGAREEELGICKRGEKYLELLSHNQGDYDLSALNNDGALLDEHDERYQIGKVQRAEISQDRKGRAVVEFDGVTDLSKTRFEQMRRRSRPHVSFGYQQTGFVGDETLADGRVAKRVRWAADEISSVARPADPTVGSRRSAADLCHCTRCGGTFARDMLDADFRCDDCGPVARSLRQSDQRLTRGADGPQFSLCDLADEVSRQAQKDARFTGTDNKGQPMGWVSVRDIRARAEQWLAILYCSVDGKNYSVDLNFDADGKLTLGPAVEVKVSTQTTTTYDPVAEDRPAGSASPERAAGADVNRRSVDSAALADAEATPPTATQQPNKNMSDNITPELENQVRSKIEPQIRTAIAAEHKTRAEKIVSAKKELRALADEHVKTSGMNWAGKPGQVVVVGERIRSLEQAAYEALEAGTPESEVRNSFKVDCGELVRSSRAPRNQVEAACLPDQIASRCSLRSLYNAAAKAMERGQRTSCFMPTEGAELEAHQELTRTAAEFPGGNAVASEGVCLPFNMRSSGLRGDLSRLKRDALAGDYPTAGALIAPEYKFPTIELLRNRMALSRAGITVLGGVMGNLILPRQTGASVAQSLAEGAILAKYDQTFDQIRMTPHRIGSSQLWSRLAMLQTTEDFEALVMNDHIAIMALKADYLGINGSGANDEPLGILNQIGIGSVVFGGSASAAYKNIIAMETAIRKANIDEPPTFITTPAARGTLRITPATLTGSTVVSGASNALWNGEELAGRPAVDTNQVPNDVLVALVGRHVVFAQWGGLSVVLDTLTAADADKVKLSTNTYIDYALRHPQAVARSADSVATLA